MSGDGIHPTGPAQPTLDTVYNSKGISSSLPSIVLELMYTASNLKNLDSVTQAFKSFLLTLLQIFDAFTLEIHATVLIRN